ncbi:hypothetical protein PR003_g17351 [Phytophthora rubi]|uniref:Reverse transcriptase RNase H-like domain-containing protein n=1 Tax=Phytophthora rubi TaxID=129364 RepID=A0A6A3JLM6_9STRA|nr:hypothetical protein PR001_g20014 [Phytophthora rubi]KAE8999972.1 hypothetical protein PR002_g18308 [Phytophthora rubi]KAE9321925.1 hypothetical protein PR003_g17351 [Phytophthora rubi]
MRYTLINLLGEQPVAFYPGHASLCTAAKSPHLSQRMTHWLSLFSECNFVVYDQMSKNILADALSRRLENVQWGRHEVGDEDDDEWVVYIVKEVAAVEVAPTTPLRDLISAAYN